MEISFISEVGKKNIPEMSRMTNFEGNVARGERYPARSPGRRTKTDCTVVSVRTDNAGPSTGWATPKTRSPGVQLRVTSTAPSARGSGA